MMLATAAAATTSAAVLEFARGHPYWPLRLLAVYLGNPIVFLSYMLAMGDGTNQDGKTILGFKAFKTVSTNTSQINFFLFLLITLPLYVLWFYAQVNWIVPGLLFVFRSSRTLSIDKFCTNYAGVGACIASTPGLLNMFVWSTSGMEGNVMGFIFALPLLVAVIAYVAMWFVAVCSSLEYQQVLSYDDALVSMSPSPAA
jgi:hypothetical protein